MKLKVFPLISGTRERSSLSPFLFSTTLEVLAKAIKKKEEEEIKGIWVKKKLGK